MPCAATKFGLTIPHTVHLARGGQSTRVEGSKADVAVRLAKRPLAKRQGVAHGLLIGKRGRVASENVPLFGVQVSSTSTAYILTTALRNVLCSLGWIESVLNAICGLSGDLSLQSVCGGEWRVSQCWRVWARAIYKGV